MNAGRTLPECCKPNSASSTKRRFAPNRAAYENIALADCARR